MRGSERLERTTNGRRAFPVTRATSTAALLAAALLAVACGGDGEGTAQAPDQDTAAETAATGQDEDGADEPTDNGDAAGQEQAADDPATSDRVIDTTLTGADGWNDPLDLDIPDPETAVLELAGERYTFNVSCQFPGEVPDSIMAGGRQMNELVLFDFAIAGLGQDDSGRNVRIDIRRAIYVDGDRALQIRNEGWGGEGQFDRIVFTGIGEAASLTQSPSSEDPAGDRLPLVRVTPEGVVTAEGELIREFAEDTAAPEGPFTFAGRCQEAWPQDAIDAAGG